MKKNIVKTVITAAVAAGIFAGIGSQSVLAEENVKVTLGVVGSVYEELWAPAQEALKEEGIDLEIVQFSDYVTPNNALNSGEIDLAAGLITLKDDADFSPTLDDIETYNVDITIEELAANTIPSTLADVTAAVVNGNYALDFGLKTEEAIFQDTSVDEHEYWNLIAAITEDLSDPEKVELYSKVVAAFQTDATEEVFNETYGGYFIAEGWDEDLLADYKAE